MSRPRRARGAVLVTALVLMLLVLAMAVAGARSALEAEKSTRQERDRETAFAAAEAALADAERDIEGAAGAHPGRASLFSAGAGSLGDGCGKGADDLGLCPAQPGTPVPAWQATDLAADDAPTVGYGAFTGAHIATGAGPLPAREPRYIIELLPFAAGTPNRGHFFRITAVGFGASERTRVVLQSFYRKPASAPAAPGGHGRDDEHGPPGPDDEPAATLPSGRIAWREVANWPELHQAATE